jgi:glutamyl-tRNA reductase
MQGKSLKDLSHFFVAGINYKKTDAALRSRFAVQERQYEIILQTALSHEINDVFILSTCNRTEIYGFAPLAGELIDLISPEEASDKKLFLDSAYTKSGIDAIAHLFHVSAGLDSQILGDYEIVAQIKSAVKFAKVRGCITNTMERLVNTVLQSSKAVKNKTAISDGTVSVSFAAIQYIRENVKNFRDKKILLLGVGKIGRNTCKNLVDYLGTTNITLINRSPEKALAMATELGLKYAPIADLEKNIASSDIIFVATDAAEPTVLASQLETENQKWVLDLSIPNNVEPAAASLKNITLVNVDELSMMKDETLAMREAEVPKAKAIIQEHIEEFTLWYDLRKHVPLLKAVKVKLREIHSDPLFIPLYQNAAHNSEEKIQRVINGMASKMKEKNQKGCHYIEAINEFIATGTI